MSFPRSLYDLNGSNVVWTKFIPQFKTLVSFVEILNEKVEQLTALNKTLTEQLAQHADVSSSSVAHHSPDAPPSLVNVESIDKTVEELCERVFLVECAVGHQWNGMDDYMKEDPDYVKTVDEHFGVTNYSEDISGLKQAGKVWSPKRIVPAKFGKGQLAQSQSKNPTTSTNHPTLAMKSQSYASVIKKAPKVVRGTRTGTSEGPSRELTETLQAKHQPHADFCVRGIPRVEDSKFDSVKDYNAFIAKQLEDVGIPTRFVSVYVPARGDRRSSTFARIGTFKDMAKKILEPEIWPTNVFVREWVY